MSDISVPHNLAKADAVISLADSLSVLLDPSKRKAIADDIKAHHALNEAEAKKAEDARSLIKQHSDVLAETRLTEARILKASKDLDQSVINFKTEKDAEWAKVAIAKGEAKDALEKAQALHKQASDIQDRATQKESELNKARDEHADNVRKLADDRSAVEKQRMDVEALKQQVLALDAQTKEKVAKLKQFNF